ncbi:MAG TPA: tRNA (adenosine(37)-N6)-dimethylallyltransferase MiaA [Candidatus Kapabacteria bacterium]|nr:tRNA (adenosine(37)-N6)-dimethylallyltransferase MiaA [Candidatus Kapabacteria bacterium]
MKIQVITGPTASGKTALALQKARADTHIEIVNADASLVYKGFDIGTAKPSMAERTELHHHLIDTLEPSQSYSAADYSLAARAVIQDIIARGSIPIVVGGTGLYIDALFYGLATTDVDEEQRLKARAEYDRQLAQNGFEAMLNELKPLDPVLYEQIARERNPRRLQRAWEFYLSTGTSLGEARQQKPDPFEHLPEFIVLLPEREELRTRIVHRVDAMLTAGWLEEVQRLLETGVNDDVPAMKSIGYQLLAKVIRGQKKLSIAREEIINQTRQYAKRQITWMKKYGNHTT